MTDLPNNEFYVGYFPKMPSTYRKTILLSVIGIVLMLCLVMLAFTFSQRPFLNSTFEYGTYTELTGTLYTTPYPLLKVSQGNDLNGKPIYKSVLLVNFGKKGVKEIVDQLQNKIGNLEEYEITLRGTLIYYDGKTSLEFTDGPDSIIKYEKSNVKTLPRQTTALGTQKFTGEIVDPKCYLGVMKPAWGKAHRSCARRCISGGIPPVLIVTNQQGESNYLLITDKTGSPLHGEILPFVGLNVEMEGEVEQVDDWLVLKVNLNDIVLSTTVNGWFENLLTELKIIEENEICHIHPTSFISLCY